MTAASGEPPHPPGPGLSPRDRLIGGALTLAANGGISHLSLRQLATELGTSHRMLIYHFGSLEGLIAEIVQVVEQQQVDALELLMRDDGLPPAEQARQFWEHVVDAAAIFGPLFFELTGQALQGRPHTTSLLDRLVDMWLEPLAELYVRQGISAEQAPVHARLGLAAARGLLLDLLVTGDRIGVDAAMDMLGRMVLAEAARP
jgi:AcrR family transcriptional regulator